MPIRRAAATPTQQEAPSAAAEKGWKRESLPADRESQQAQDLLKKVCSILNKATPEKFPQLMKQVKDLNINTEEQLKGVVELVFEKAIDEPSFSVTYGNMCRCLAELKVPTTADPNTTVSFIKLLGSCCKEQFEKYKEDDVVYRTKKMELDSAASTDRDRLQVELQEAEGIICRRSKGNIKFIGELYKIKTLTTANIQGCIVKMLSNHIEESLESLCILLTTIGKDSDLVVAKPQMDLIFNQMQSIVREGQTSSRIRFMLEDVIELRLHNLVPRRADQGPKTLEQIHRGAMIEEQENQRRVQHQLLSKDNKQQPDPSKQLDQRVPKEGPWKSVSVWNNSRTIDPNKSPTFKPINLGVQGPPPSKGVRDVDQLQKSENAWFPASNGREDPAGPRAQVTWVKGSGGGAKASDSELARTAGLKRISVLQSTPPSPPPSTTPPPESKRIPEPDNAPKLQQVVEETSSPGLVQPEGPVDRREAQHMERVLLDDKASEQQIFNCVKKKVDKSQVSSSPYLRELMTAVCKAAEKENTDCRVHAALLQERSPVQLKTLNSESERQQQALDKLQALIVTLDEPPDLLRIFFDCHCDEDVISEYAFWKYGIHKDPADLLGKGVALNSVTAFFTWLREAE